VYWQLALILMSLVSDAVTGGDQKTRSVWERSCSTPGPCWANHKHCTGPQV